MDIKKYLSRFNASALTEPTYDTLCQLQQFHMQRIPFENFDVMRRKPIYLNLERIYKKIVDNNRGGYCYEVNGLFHWALGELGFDAQLGAATVRRPTGFWAKADTHVVILVKLDKVYLTDVGFGDSNYHPIPLDGTVHTDVSGTYKVIQQDEQLYHLTRKDGSDWIPLYQFSTEEKNIVDFHEGVVFNQVSKDSSFTHTDLATLATDKGRVTLSDQSLITKENNEIKKVDLSDDEKMNVLKDIFGIVLKEDK